MNLQRLKTRPQFQAVLAGTTLARTPHFALHCCDLQQPTPLSDFPNAFLFSGQGVWLGAMVPKRWAKRAVTRNTIKRQIYNVSVAYAKSLPERAHVVRLRSAFQREEFKSATSSALRMAVRTELHQLFVSQLKASLSIPANSLAIHQAP